MRQRIGVRVHREDVRRHASSVSTAATSATATSISSFFASVAVAFASSLNTRAAFVAFVAFASSLNTRAAFASSLNTRAAFASYAATARATFGRSPRRLYRLVVFECTAIRVFVECDNRLAELDHASQYSSGREQNVSTLSSFWRSLRLAGHASTH